LADAGKTATTYMYDISSQRKYIGQHYDAQTGLDYMNARYYNAKTGRFISQDPAFWAPTADELKAQMINPQLFNEYSYAGNNPISGSDPSGRIPVLPVIMGALYVGGLVYSGHDTYSTMTNPNATALDRGQSVGLAWCQEVGLQRLV